MNATRVTIELTTRELERLDARVRIRNEGIVGRPTNREEEIRRILIDDLGLTDKLPRGFWPATGRGGSNRTDGPNG